MARRGKRSDDGQYTVVPFAQIKSPAWRSLSGAAVKVWCELSARFNGGNNGRLTLSCAEAAETLGMGKATVQRGFKELEAKGFIRLVIKGNWYHRRAHEWRLTTKPTQTAKGKVMATNDWRSWQPEKTKRGSGMEPSHPSVVPFQNPKAKHGSISEPVRAKSRASLGSESEH
ncbi:MAG: helix-turn-helix domain-containing protein [Planctomycetaceae bacterium]|nr:helix-turn-helix domain-containing protein [Planctomycetaceae bacterium]